MVKRIFKYFLYAVVSALLLLIIVAGITQTSFFKNRLRVVLIHSLSSQIKGSLQLGTIRGNFLTGLSIDSIAIYHGNELFLRTGNVSIEHRALTILKKKIDLSRISISNPEIHFHQSLAGEWNYNALFPPSASNDSAASAWLVNVREFSIIGGLIEVVDSLTLASSDHEHMPSHYVEYHNYSLRNIEIHASGTYSSENLSATISAAHAVAMLPEQKLLTLAARVTANAAGVEIKRLNLKTDGSDFDFNGRIKDLNIFRRIEPAKLQYDSTSVHLLARKIDLEELDSFFPNHLLSNGSLFVQLDAAGSFGNLNITHLNIQTPKSLLRISGNIKNLHRPDDLIINAALGDSKIDGPELAKLLPKSESLNLEDAGLITTFAQYSGTLKEFTAGLSLKSKVGEIETKGHVLLVGGAPQYDIKYSTHSLDVQKILQIDFPLKLSMNGFLKGEGISLDSLNSVFVLNIDTAQIERAALTKSTVTLNAQARRIQTTAHLQSANMGAELNANADFTNPQMPTVHADMSLYSVDLSRILSDTSLNTSLSLKAALSSTGRSVDDLSGTLTIDTYNSRARGIDISEKHVGLELDQHVPSNRHLKLQSSFADAELNGAFDLDIVAAYLTEQMPNLLRRIVKYPTADTTLRVNERALATIREHKEENKNIEFGYSIQVKDIAPVLAILRTTPVDAKAGFEGVVKGDAERLSITTKASVPLLEIGEADKKVQLKDARLNFDVRDIVMRKTLANISGSLDFSVGSASLHLPQMTDVKGSADFGNSQCAFNLKTTLDSSYFLSLHGSARLDHRTYRIGFDTVELRTHDYDLRNDGEFTTIIDSAGISIPHGVIRHHDDSLSVSGLLRNDGSLDVRAALAHFPLDELKTFIHSADAAHPDLGVKGNTTAELHLTGSPETPVFTFKASIDSTFYRWVNLGHLQAAIDYNDRLAHIDITSHTGESDSLPALQIRGTLPINLVFAGVEQRFPDAAQKLHIQSQAFELGLLQRIFPELENLSGTAVTDLDITGTPHNPEYRGSLAIKSARFTFQPNNIAYIMAGDMVPRGEKITLQNFTIRNIPEENTRGEMKVDGSLIMKDFDLDSFDLTANGDLLIMNDATRSRFTTFYGTIYTETDTGGIHFKGTQDHPVLTGGLNVRQANLTFPPEKAAVTTSTGLPYFIVDDTSKQVQMNSPNVYRASRDTSGRTKIESVRPLPRESFLSKLRYDLIIQTQGKTSVTMIFTPATNEELYAELDGKVHAVNDQGTANVFGDIAIGSQSYYNFIKRFNANGKLQYVGPWENPQMNITAIYQAYKQISDTSHNRELVIVQIDISGTRTEPKFAIGMKVQTDPSQEPVEWTNPKGGDVQSDALSFMLTGKFRDELTSADNQAISSVGSAAGTSLVSGLTSNVLSNVLTTYLQREFPFIQSATVSYEGGNPDLRISGEVGKGYVRFGGKVLNDIGNASVSYQMSLGDVLNSRSIRNLFIELDHEVEGTASDESHKNATTNTARIYYRISF